MPDELFENPRLAVLYDWLNGERDDLVHYRSIVQELDASSVLDVGCGTGTLACSLAATGVEVVGLDPAAASLDVAMAKQHAERVRWIVGDATTVPPLQVDVAMMTGNVAQVFVDDASWLETLTAIGHALRPGGTLVFETRDPARRAWERWTPEASRQRAHVDGVGEVETWHDVIDVSPPLVTFVTTFRFVSTNEELRSRSTLRFRDLAELRRSLHESGFEVVDVRDAPDRPTLEFVVLATRR